MMGYNLLFCARGKEKAKIAPIARHVKDQLDIIAFIFFTAQADIETFNTPPKQEKNKTSLVQETVTQKNHSNNAVD